MSSLRSETIHAGGLVLIEHELDVPLDHGTPDGETITAFAREVADADPNSDGRDRPFLVFLQGGPGQEAPRPGREPTNPGWLDRALADHRVLMVDQRGTGRSTPVGVVPGTPEQQAAYLSHFRADAIVEDCEALREALGVETWSVLGQSFGGFCALRYLSEHSSSLREVYFTGGVPPVALPVDEVYAATYVFQRERNRRYHATYPADRARIERILELCTAGELVLADGTVMTPGLFRQIGNVLGMSDGATTLHALLERDPRSPAFVHDLAAALPFRARNPLYAAVHEACYADGQATNWSAERVMPDDFRTDPTLLTGEHVLRSTFADNAGLRPLADAADLLAAHEWPRLYNAAVLAEVDVPCAAAVYTHDPYVLRELSLATAAAMPSMRVWETDQLEHNGLRVDGANVLERLFALARA